MDRSGLAPAPRLHVEGTGVNSAHVNEALENVRTASQALRAFMDFQDRVAAVAIEMAGRGDPTSLRLLDAMRDLQARTGEIVTTGEDDV